jgi:hypothetical protein
MVPAALSQAALQYFSVVMQLQVICAHFFESAIGSPHTVFKS